jgi:hypothetical protein
LSDVGAALQAAALDAVTILHACLLDSSPSIRIRAAVAILNLKSSEEMNDLENRVRALELRR